MYNSMTFKDLKVIESRIMKKVAEVNFFNFLLIKTMLANNFLYISQVLICAYIYVYVSTFCVNYL